MAPSLALDGALTQTLQVWNQLPHKPELYEERQYAIVLSFKDNACFTKVYDMLELHVAGAISERSSIR